MSDGPKTGTTDGPAGAPRRATRRALVERWRSLPTVDLDELRLDLDSVLEPSISETYGDEAITFLETPRASLAGRTPEQAALEGDLDAIQEIVRRDHLGDWA